MDPTISANLVPNRVESMGQGPAYTTTEVKFHRVSSLGFAKIPVHILGMSATRMT